jgi:hypothetical protein
MAEQQNQDVQPKQRRGRKKGVPNKLTIKTRQELEQLIAKRGPKANPFLVQLELMEKSEFEHIRLSAAQWLGSRLLPALKSIEVSGDPDRPVYYVDQAARQKRIAELQAKLVRGGLTLVSNGQALLPAPVDDDDDEDC